MVIAYQKQGLVKVSEKNVYSNIYKPSLKSISTFTTEL